MLIDTVCTKIMVSTDWLDHDCTDYDQTEKILCVHGDMVCYPTDYNWGGGLRLPELLLPQEYQSQFCWVQISMI